MIYTVGGIKGGSGKTTVATNLVVWLARNGADVLLVDADDQHTATDFTAWREITLGEGNAGFSSLKLVGEQVRREVLKLKDKFTHVVIDAGGRDTVSQRAALIVSDAYLLPFNPRSPDMWTAGQVQSLLAEVRALKDGLTAFAFINRADGRGADNTDAGQELAALEGVTFIEASLGNRKAFPNAISKGLSVIELKPADQKAIMEVNHLFSLITTTNGSNKGSHKENGSTHERQTSRRKRSKKVS